MTKAAVARRIGISAQWLCDIEAGRRNAPYALLERMAEVLGCPVVVLQAAPSALGARDLVDRDA